MNNLGIFIGIIAGTVWTFFRGRGKDPDRVLEAEILKFAENENQFTIKQYIKKNNQAYGFLAKNKIRMAASRLLPMENWVATCLNLLFIIETRPLNSIGSKNEKTRY